MIPERFTFAPLGELLKTAEALPLSSPILLVMRLPALKLRIASVSARRFPETDADVRVPMVVTIW